MVDILLCHYVEPVTDSMQTLKKCLSLQYAPELTDIFVLDDGCTYSMWAANKDFKVTVNTNVIEIVVTCAAILRDDARACGVTCARRPKIEDVASPAQLCP